MLFHFFRFKPKLWILEATENSLREMNETQGKMGDDRGLELNKKTIYYHAVGWALFITYELVAVKFLSKRPSSAPDLILHYILNASLFYLNALYVLPHAYRSKSFFQYRIVVAMLLVIIGYNSINFCLNALQTRLSILTAFPVSQLITFVAASTWRCIYFLLLSSAYWLAVHVYWSRVKIDLLYEEQLLSKTRELELQQQVIVNENAFLKAQINPHFLFNTLNFIYNIVSDLSDDAGEAVLLLADISRYSLKTTDQYGKQSLKEEIQQVENMVKLVQLRYDQILNINLVKKISSGDIAIPPLLLVTLVENVFKYGALKTEPAEILIEATHSNFFFRTCNAVASGIQTESNGIGLSNTRLRLEKSYPGRHSIQIKNDGQNFILELSIALQDADMFHIR